MMVMSGCVRGCCVRVNMKEVGKKVLNMTISHFAKLFSAAL